MKHTPRATPTILLDYESAVRQGIIALSKNQGVPLVDLAGELNGHREAFGDLVHFSDQGAAVAAKLVADEVLRVVKTSTSRTESSLQSAF
jgi:lysophospholipase L1-like esterase